MTDVAAIVALICGLISIGSVIYFAGFKLAGLEVKVNTVWDFLMRRAMSEAIHSGVGGLNSPFELKPAAKEWMQVMASDLRAFYAKLGRKLTDAELALEIERHFGQRILEQVCIPHGIYQGACLLIAVELAKEKSQ